MCEDIYSKPDLSKKIRFKTSKKENGNTDITDDIDNVTIYDNYLTEESPRPKVEKNLTEDQQQITVSSGKSKFPQVAAVFLGLLCLLLLAAVIVLVALLIQDKNSWNTERRELMSERQELQKSIADIHHLNANLSKTTSLLKDANGNLTKEREKRQQQFDDHFQQGWVHFNHSFYYISSVKKNWDESRKDCLQRVADLVIIDSEEEQKFAERLSDSAWIGLKYNESTEWTWVDETPLNSSVSFSDWLPRQPNRVRIGHHCVENKRTRFSEGWNDAPCRITKTWICEKKMAL